MITDQQRAELKAKIESLTDKHRLVIRMIGKDSPTHLLYSAAMDGDRLLKELNSWIDKEL